MLMGDDMNATIVISNLNVMDWANVTMSTIVGMIFFFQPFFYTLLLLFNKQMHVFLFICTACSNNIMVGFVGGDGDVYSPRYLLPKRVGPRRSCK